MDYKTLKCNACGRLKGEANHWFRAKVTPGEIRITTTDRMEDRTHDFCGFNCLMSTVNRILENGLDAEPGPDDRTTIGRADRG